MAEVTQEFGYFGMAVAFAEDEMSLLIETEEHADNGMGRPGCSGGPMAWWESSPPGTAPSPFR